MYEEELFLIFDLRFLQQIPFAGGIRAVFPKIQSHFYGIFL